MNILYPGTIDFIKKITHLILYIQSKLQIPIIHFYFFIIKKKIKISISFHLYLYINYCNIE